MQALEQQLQGRLSHEELCNTLDFYSESIDDRMEDGLSEEEAVAAMGSIDQITRQFFGGNAREQAAPQPAPETHTRPAFLRVLGRIVKVVLSILTVMVSVMLHIFAVALPLGALGSGAVGVFCMVKGFTDIGLVLLGGALVVLALGIGAIVAVRPLTRLLWRFTRWLSKVITGKEDAE